MKPNPTPGKIALVTGALRGVGRAVTVSLARVHVDVIALDWRPGQPDENGLHADFARDFGALGIRVNAVLPDQTNTNLLMKGNARRAGDQRRRFTFRRRFRAQVQCPIRHGCAAARRRWHRHPLTSMTRQDGGTRC